MIQHIRNFPNYKKKLWTAFCNTICLQLFIGLPSAMVLCCNEIFMAPFKAVFFSYWIVFILLLIKRGYLLKEVDLQYLKGISINSIFS